MRRAPLIGVLCCGALAALLLTAAPAPAAVPASKERDAQLVYCLGAEHRDGLADAAVRLGLLARDPGAAELARWAADEPDDFARACTALMAAAAESPADAAKDDPGWFRTLVDAVPLLVAGALLTLLGQVTERASAERGGRRRAVDTAAESFRSAATQYLRAYETRTSPDHAPVLAARDLLAGALAAIPPRTSRGRAARRAADGLPLAAPLQAAAHGRDLGPDERRARAAQERTRVADRLADVATVNRWTGARWWRGRRTRGSGGTA